MIKLYDWYKDSSGRVFCVVRIWADGKSPASIDLLEVGAVGPISQPEPVILDLLQRDLLRKLKP